MGGDFSHRPEPMHAADEISERELGVRVGVLRFEHGRLLEEALRPVPRVGRELGEVRSATKKRRIAWTPGGRGWLKMD